MTRSRGCRPPVLVLLALACLACAKPNGATTSDPPEQIAMVDAMRNAAMAQLPLTPGMVVADIGAGQGWFVGGCTAAIGPRGVVYTTDIQPAAVDYVRTRHAALVSAGRVVPRLCRDRWDTGLDDLPAERVDLMLMIDSLCFADQKLHDRYVAYLQRLLRLLKPGGRLVHHMDCGCDITPERLADLFAAAGFAPAAERFDLPPVAPSPAISCQTAEQRERVRFMPVFRKP